MRSSRTTPALLLAALVLAALGAFAFEGATHRAAAVTPVPVGKGGGMPSPTGVPDGNPSDREAHAQLKSRIQDLDAQLKSLREQFHGQLDPLQSQVKAVRDQFEPRIKDLDAQRKQLVEEGKSSAMRALDQQEDADLAALAEREKAGLRRGRSKLEDEARVGDNDARSSLM